MDERAKLVQEVIDRLLYFPEYVDKLKELNQQFDPHSKVKYTTGPLNFTYNN